MADVSHELGALRFVVDSPLSSKVAMFNNAATKHQQSQHLNPFSQSGGLPKPTFNKNEYGKPIAGSLTEMRGQKANIHVLKEMLELCQIIDSEGYDVKDEPTMKVIPFGELFNIYTYVSDKVVGILLRARKHKLIDFEGEVLFQRRDDDVPVFLLKPIQEIRRILEQKQDEIRRSVSPAPQATTVMMDQQKRSASLSPKPSKKTEKSEKPPTSPKPQIVKPIAQKATPAAPPTITVQDDSPKETPEGRVPDPANPASTVVQTAAAVAEKQTTNVAPQEVTKVEVATTTTEASAAVESTQITLPTIPPQTIVTPPTPTTEPSTVSLQVDPSIPASDQKTDINNNAEGEVSLQTADASANTENDPPAEGPSTL